MNTNKTEILDRNKLKYLINDMSIKHVWLASQIKVSEKTLTRWINGDVTRIRVGNLKKLAEALNCEIKVLIASSEIDVYSSLKNRDVLVNELYNDSLLYELLVSSKIKLAISLIKSTLHSKLPSAILASFYIKLGYASLIHRKLKTAKKYFSKAALKAQVSNNLELTFSVDLGFAITHLFDCNYELCLDYLGRCDTNKAYAKQEKAHFYSTFSLFYFYTGQFKKAIICADNCITECSPGKTSIEKKLFLCTALQIKGACHLFTGNAEQALTYCIDSLAVAKQSGYERCVDISKSYLSAVNAFQGNIDTALQLSTESLQHVNEKDISLPSLLCIAIYVHRMSGDYLKVLEIYEELSKISKEYMAPRAFAEYQLSLIEQAKGDDDNAHKIHLQVIESLNELGLKHWITLLTNKP